MGELHRQTADQPCGRCHTEPTGGRLTIAFHSAGEAASPQEDCAACHNTQSWQEVRLRSHPRLPEFGGHMRIPCLECHPDTLRRAVPCRDCHGRGGRFFEAN